MKIHPGVTLEVVGMLWCVREVYPVNPLPPFLSLHQAFLLSVSLEPSAVVSPQRPDTALCGTTASLMFLIAAKS